MFIIFQEKGLVIISTEQGWNDTHDQNNSKIRRTLVSVENAQLLQDAGEGCLGKHNKNGFICLLKFTDMSTLNLKLLNLVLLNLYKTKNNKNLPF